jgi:hypothetical protein
MVEAGRTTTQLSTLISEAEQHLETADAWLVEYCRQLKVDMRAIHRVPLLPLLLTVQCTTLPGCTKCGKHHPGREQFIGGVDAQQAAPTRRHRFAFCMSCNQHSVWTVANTAILATILTTTTTAIGTGMFGDYT